MLTNNVKSASVERLPLRRVLVTGAAGFIGSRLVRALAEDPAIETYALVRRTPVPVYSNVVYVYQDLALPFSSRHLPSHLDAIIHLAALLIFDEGDSEHMEAAVNLNVGGTLRLLAYARDIGARLFIHGSTGGVYGSRDGYSDESDPFNPMDFYSVTKCQAETTVHYFNKDFSTAILRYWYPYGLGTPNPIQGLVRKVIDDQPVTVLRSGKPRINPLHVDDAVAATVLSLGLSGHHVLNVAGLEVTSFRDVAERCARVIRGPEARPRLQLLDDAEAHPFHRRDALGRIDRIQALLEWRPVITLDDGLARFVAELQATQQEQG